MKEIIYFLTAGSFVYFALKLQGTYGDIPYFVLASICLIVGYLLGT